MDMKDIKGIGKSLFRTDEKKLRYSKEQKGLIHKPRFDQSSVNEPWLASLEPRLRQSSVDKFRFADLGP
ncbi:hypothetical protein PV325_008531 [Microctonus aethiopoides]|nr:hypothetical protein PV325_008531 [Microctonus aethiopoides]